MRPPYDHTLTAVKMCAFALFVTECVHRIYSCRSKSGYKAGRNRRDPQQGGYICERNWIERADVVE